MDVFGGLEEAKPYELLVAGVNTHLEGESVAAERAPLSKKRKREFRGGTENRSTKVGQLTDIVMADRHY